MKGAQFCSFSALSPRASAVLISVFSLVIPMTAQPLSSHEQQLQLRETMRRADERIAAVLQRFEELTGHTVRGVSVARYPSGAYCAQVQIGGAPRPAVEPVAAESAAAPPSPLRAR